MIAVRRTARVLCAGLVLCAWQARVVRAAPTPVFAVADTLDGLVTILSQTDFKPVRQLSGFRQPQGVAYDAAGNLYVADTGAGRVFVYPPGAAKPSRILGDFAKFPADVAPGADGTAYVANAVTNITPAGVAVFPPKARLPARILSDASIAQALFVAADGAGDVFLAYFDAKRVPHVGEFVAGRAPLMALGVAVGFPGKLRVVGDTLYVVDQSNNTLGIYAPPYGAPTQTLSFTRAKEIVGFDFASGGRTLLATDNGNAAVEIYPVAGGAPVRSLFQGGSLIGIAAYPPPP